MSVELIPNTRVRLKTAPDRVGRITGKIQERTGRVRYEVDFGGDSLEFFSAGNIEVAEENEDVATLIERGKYGSVKHLRMTMTHIRLSGRLADVIYSMEASNTEFYAYQFKPVINYLNSPSNGLLIADEVGLGKTIEAGLIWTEMRSRFDSNKLLVVAPAALREKWQEELAHRFGVRADICNAEELLGRLRQHQRRSGEGFAIIASLQGLRPPAGWDREGDQGNHSPRAELSRFFREHDLNETLFDCVVVDEAHYLKNAATHSYALVEGLRSVSHSLILLSATPIQMKSTDLFQLLKLIDPQNFRFEFAFGQILEANEPIVKLSGALREGPVKKEDYLELVGDCRQHQRFASNRQLEYLENNPPTTAQLKQPDQREALATRIDRINMLAQVVNRTRKRFVNEHKVIRIPVAPLVEMTRTERSFYNTVTEVVRDYCDARELNDEFILTIPQRQMCSSIPAAYRAWVSRAQEDFKTQLYENGFVDVSANRHSVGPLVQELAKSVANIADFDLLRREDSKFGTVMGQLQEYWKVNPGKKVVLFSYYRETLRYLKERMDEAGIGSQLLYGGMPETKQDAIARFRDSSNTRILLASEVASEGVDIQFASFLVNYDLPWNPMKIEQRIGRIDRIGQKEDRILIHNYFYADTLDDRIYQRLFERLDIFRSALGDLEHVLGDQVRDFTYDLLSHKMTREEEAARIQQAETAIAHIKKTQEQLENEATHFAAHGDYVLNQVRAARDMKRYVRGEHLWTYVQDFLIENYPGSIYVQQSEEPLVVDMELSSDARADLREFINKKLPDRRTRLATSISGDKVKCVFSNHVDFISGRQEMVNQHHALIRFITSTLTSGADYSLIAARVGATLLPQVLPGKYLFICQRWSTTGARVVERVIYRAKSLENDLKLSADDAERIVSITIDHGMDAFDVSQELDGPGVRDIYEELVFDLDEEFEEYAEEMKMENEDRVEMMTQAARQKVDMQISSRREAIQKLEEEVRQLKIAGNTEREKVIRRVITANEGNIRKQEGHLLALIDDHEKKRAISSVPFEVMAGVIAVD